MSPGRYPVTNRTPPVPEHPIALTALTAAIEDAGLTPRGAFAVTGEDGVPDLAGGRPARAAILIGNSGAAMWARFSREQDPSTDRLDEWSRQVIGDLARRFQARAVFPFDTPPWPFQRWAARAEGCRPSPLGIYVHPRYGLWHAYRGALLLASPILSATPAPTPAITDHPCDRCRDRPCLAGCPVGAFTDPGYDVARCAAHLGTPAGHDCMDRGCLARHACPVGREFTYEPAQARFHMRAFFKAVAPSSG